MRVQGEDRTGTHWSIKDYLKPSECLQQKRCNLLILTMPTILSSGEQAGHYRAGYWPWATVWYIGESLHQSYSDLNQSEKPKEADIARRQRVDNDQLSRLFSLQLAEAYCSFCFGTRTIHGQGS